MAADLITYRLLHKLVWTLKKPKLYGPKGLTLITPRLSPPYLVR
jgi:hypothetical protein